MPQTLQALSRLIFPVILLTLAWYLLSEVHILDASNRALLGYVPYVLAAIAAALSLQFNRSRLAASSVLLACVFWLIQNFLQSSLSGPQAYYVYVSLSLLVPLNIALLALLPERGLWNHFGFLYLLITPAFCAYAYWQFQTRPDALQNLSDLWQIKSIEGYILSVGSTILFGIALGICLFSLGVRNNESEAMLALCLASCYVTLGWLQVDMMSTIMFSIASAGVIIGVFRSSHEMAYRDELTGLQGRRSLNERFRGLGKRYCVAMLDIDHFKKLNDSHGHDVGDEVLKLVAKRLSKIGGGSTTYRYGGEEFCAVFPQRDIEDCVPYLEEVREEIANYRITIRDKSARPTSQHESTGRRRGQASKGASVRVTISIGLAEKTDPSQSAEDVLKVADKALYKSKQGGGNRLSY